MWNMSRWERKKCSRSFLANSSSTVEIDYYSTGSNDAKHLKVWRENQGLSSDNWKGVLVKTIIVIDSAKRVFWQSLNIQIRWKAQQ